MVSRRNLLVGAALLPLTPELAAAQPVAELAPITGHAQPITADERRARCAKAQRLMQEHRIGALLIESGASLDYFTGIRWWRSERTTAMMLPARGAPILVTPAFEEPSVRESLQIDGDVRPWNEHESPFDLLVQALKERGLTSGTLAIEATTRFFIVDGIRQRARSLSIVAGDPVIRACRMIKSPAELALLETANRVTLAALAYVHGQLRPSMRPQEINAMMIAATTALGGEAGDGLVLLNEASAYPHGSHSAQELREGSVILMDFGCSLHGYQSDMSRSWVFGEPSAKQRKVWQTVKRGQEIALETAQLGVPVGRIDREVRKFYESEGWGPAYRLPGLSHRTGHGIGMEGHEPAYLVQNDQTPLAPGMCFSDEPGIYIPGEFGIRLEDCWYVSENGPKLFTPLAKSIDDPI